LIIRLIGARGRSIAALLVAFTGRRLDPGVSHKKASIISALKAASVQRCGRVFAVVDRVLLANAAEAHRIV
jgi:hypothetical protein